MPRRKQQTAVNTLHGFFLETPWWTPLLLAGLVYLGLRLLPAVFPAATDPRTGFPNYGHLFATVLAPFAPFAAGLVLLVGLLAQSGKRQRRALLGRQTGLDSLRAMRWQQFELLVGEAYRAQGYVIEERGGSGPDGGVDLVLRRGGAQTLVQCKQWRRQQVGVSIVRELYGVMASEGAAGGIVVTVGYFTPDALAFANGKPLQLIGGSELLELVRRAQVPAPSAPKVLLAGAAAPAVALPGQITRPVSSVSEMPFCPVCRRPMLLKTARKGANAGSQFWGCSGFPDCKGTRQK